MKQFLFIAITSLALLSSCRKPTPSISISVSMPEGGLSVSGGTVIVNVTSDGEWRTSTDDGIAVNPSSGTGNSSVTITVPANTTFGVRDVKVRFYSSRNTSVGQTVTIRQKSPGVSVTPKDTAVSASGGTVRVTVESEGEWKTSADDGIAVNPSSGTDNASVTITVPANTSDSERDVKVIFRSALNSSVADSVTIHQESMNLSVTSQSDSVAASGGTVGFTVRAVGGWKASAEYGATVTPLSGSGNGAVEVKFPANTTGQEREVKVTFSSTDKPSLFRTVTIRQKSISISVTPLTKSVAASGGTVSFDVTADGTWKASADCGAAVTPSEWSISGKKQVDVTVPTNTTGQGRDVTVTFRLKDNISIFRTVTISQEPINISVRPQTAEVPASSGTVDVTVTSNGEWETTVGKWTDSNGEEISTTDKVTLSSSTGTGDGTVTVKVPANTTGTERYVKVTFRSKLKASIYQTVTIHQKTLGISVTPDEFNDVPAEGGTVNVTVTSDGNWKVLRNDGYYSLSKYEGSSGDKVSVTVKENSTAKGRDVEIKFSLKSPSTVSNTVTFHQKAPSISVTGPTEEVPVGGGKATLYVTSDGGWTVSADNGAEVSPNNRQDSGNNVPVSIEIPENTTANAKKVTVTFKSALNTSVTKKVTINQKAPGISVDPTEIRDVPAKGAAYEVSVTYKYTWKSRVADWTDLNGNPFSTTYDKVTRSPSAAITGNTAVKVTVPENISGKARKATVVFYSPTDEKISQTVTIYQKASN